MKQGRAVTSHSGGKVEPRSKAINPGGVAQIGYAVGNHVMEGGETGYRGDSMHKGRGFKAPMNNSQSHHCGSQGKHR